MSRPPGPLADRSRARIAEALDGAADGLDARKLASLLDLHPNTVRWHLGVLARAGTVESAPQPDGGPGRPRTVFRLVAGRPGPGSGDYRLLATMLAGALDRDGVDLAAVEAAGREWGRELVEGEGPATGADGRAVVLGLLRRHGFRPLDEGGAIEMRRCPFGELAVAHGRVVCALHRGLVDGALAGVGAPERVAALEPFAGPGRCLLRLA